MCNQTEAGFLARYDYEEARLAEAMSESARMQTAAAEVNNATRALREQLERRPQ